MDSCEFCKRQFVREGSLVRHLCEPKRRYLQRNDKAVQLGLMAYQQFYLRSMGRKNPPSYLTFTKNEMYGAFVRFGKQLIKLNAINPIGFIDYLLTNQIKIDQWTNPTLYTAYVKAFTKAEDPVDAVERNFKLMHQWSRDTGQDWRSFFRYIETPLATLWIITGRISPWILFTASSAHVLLDRLTGEQIKAMEQIIDQSYWQIKIRHHHDEIADIRSMLAEHDI